MSEWGPEFEPPDFRNSVIGKAIRDARAIVEEHTDPNAPAFIVLPESGDPDEIDRAAKAGAILNSPEYLAEVRRRHVRRMLYGY